MNLLLDFLIKIKGRKSNKIVQLCQFCTLTILILGSLSEAARANLAITSTTDATLIENALTGQDINVSNVTINQGGTGNQVGVFTGGDTGGAGPVLSIADGVVLVTGTVSTADGPNTSISITTGGELGPSDSSLASIENGTQFDTVALQFNVVPAGNTLSMEFIFASEEYNEFVCTVFNDAMGIFVSGPGIMGEVNIARLDSNLANFSINQINGGAVGSANSFAPAPCSLDNSEFFVDNITNTTNPDETPYIGNTPSPTEVQNNYTNVEYDGFTIPLASQLQVQPGQSYTVKVVTADIGDAFWDGAVFVDNINSFNLDYGDAPDSYGTTGVDGAIQLPGPARHSTSSDPSVYLGINPPDAESNGTPATPPNPADGDDSTGDDEDAFSTGLTVTSGITSHTISDIPVNNTSTQAAQLMGWIDFNQDGDFLDAGEQTVVDVAPNQTTANLSWSGFSETTVGNTYARFRITTDSNLISSPSPVGLALDGEVEDYRVAISSPNLLLVKRITAINPERSNEITFTDFVDDSTDEDNNSKWLGSNGNTNTYTLGEIDGGQVIPNDEVEYSIYFLSNGGGTAKNVLVCDLIPEHMEFVINGFNTQTPATGGVASTGRGLLWEYNGAIESLTNGNDGDAGYYFPPGVEPTTVFPDVKCGNPSQLNTNGAVVLDLGDLPNAVSPGAPTNSYGFIRFRAKVK